MYKTFVLLRDQNLYNFSFTLAVNVFRPLDLIPIKDVFFKRNILANNKNITVTIRVFI